MSVAILVRPSALAAVREEAESAEAFDVWAQRREADHAATLDPWGQPLPECAEVPWDAVTPDMHSYVDTVRQWMECVGCGKLEVRTDW